MLDFLRQLAPRRPEALQPASPLRRLAAPGVPDMADPEADAGAWTRAAAAAASDAASPGPAPALSPPLEGTKPHRALHEPPGRAASPVVRIPAPEARSSAVRHPQRSGQAASSRDRTATGNPVAMAPLAERPAIDPDRRAPSARAAAVTGQPAPALPRPPVVAAPVSHATVARFAQEHNVPAAPPAIHVSIDRIDVRAPPASRTAPPPPRAKPAREPQSLHEYLQGKVAP